MTPPRNDEGPGDAGSGQVPPWQRVTRSDDANGDPSATQTVHYQASDWSGQASGGTERENDDLMSHTGDLPVVTGVAAPGLFGTAFRNPGRSAFPEEEAGMAEPSTKGHSTVNVASAGTKTKAVPTALRRPGRGPRRASLQVKRIDPWSVLKLSLVLGVALFLVWMVAVGVLYIVLDGMGVWTKLNGTYTSLVSGEGAESVGDPLISAGRVFGVAAIVGAINIVLMSALATVCAFIYNVSADLAGGLEVTLSERE